MNVVYSGLIGLIKLDDGVWYSEGKGRFSLKTPMGVDMGDDLLNDYDYVHSIGPLLLWM